MTPKQIKQKTERIDALQKQLPSLFGDARQKAIAEIFALQREIKEPEGHGEGGL